MGTLSSYCEEERVVPDSTSASAGCEPLYGAACGVLRRLCPNPRPRPLLDMGFSLASLARLDPLVFFSLAGIPPGEALEVSKALAGLFRVPGRRHCTYCSFRAEHVVELWSFSICGGGGVARFEGLVPVCRQCRRALEPVDALEGDARRFGWLVRWLSAVNRAPRGYVERAVGAVSEEWRRADFISPWRVELDRLKDYGVESGAPRRVLELVAGGMLGFRGETLLIPNPSAEVAVAVSDTLEGLCSGSVDAASAVLRASRLGVRVDMLVMERYVGSLLEGGSCRRRWRRWLLEGAWTVTVPATVRAKLVSELVGGRGLGGTWVLRVETPARYSDPVTVRFYTAPILDPDYFARTAVDVADLLGRLGLKDVKLRLYPRDPRTGRLWGSPLYTYRAGGGKG
jgi:hypothetical protein